MAAGWAKYFHQKTINAFSAGIIPFTFCIGGFKDSGTEKGIKETGGRKKQKVFVETTNWGVSSTTGVSTMRSILHPVYPFVIAKKDVYAIVFFDQ